ncbi:hypothetical protein ACFOTA_20145 [Chitinophaga sp. GCM10012297]|uniref:DUF1440 domain-containing protein n=1 Tax=Chitinophaga chungangae TaxID=2821488 RepID=A0ABS3YIL6_9BACT|nr:hypothetical protein [Chitinophaga chungangae]MBO9154535.1 hypothetical protein [Chitinophaga chungangae]
MVSIQERTAHPLRAVLMIGCTVWLLDGAAAVIGAYARNGVSPERVFQYISTSVMGMQAFRESSAIWLGVFLHFLVALGWSALFFFVYPRTKLLQGNKWLTGCLYGLFVWVMMNLVIVPLTSVPPSQFSLSGAVIGWLIHMACVGLPIVLLTREWYRKKWALA